MTRTTKANDLRRLSSLQQRVNNLEKDTDDPHIRKQLRQVKNDMAFVRADVSHLHERIEDLDHRVSELEDKEEK